MNRYLLGALVGVTLVGSAHAAGFAVDTHGGKATGLATAVASHIDDPSAVFYNPAGLLHMHDFQVALGDTVILPVASYRPEGSTKDTSAVGISPPPHLYAAMRVTPNLAAGFGIFTNYGSSVTWPEDFEYRWRVQRSSLATYYLNPSAAYSAFDGRVRLGAGLQLVRGQLRTQRKLNFVSEEGLVTLEGGGWATGMNAGVQVDLIKDKLEFGFSFRSAVTFNVTGRATFEQTPPEMATLLRNQNVRAELSTPDTAFAGISYRLTPALLVAADINFYRWSSLQEIVFEFENPDLTQRIPKRWRDTFNYHLGVEYKAGPLALRAGAVYDPTPSPENTLTMELPDSTRVKGAVGVGYAWRRFQFDAGYQYVHLTGSKSTYPGYEGTYSGRAHVFGLTMGWRP